MAESTESGIAVVKVGARSDVAESTEGGIAVVNVGAALWVGGILLRSVFGWGSKKTMVKL